MTIQEKLHIMQLLERLESTKVHISTYSSLMNGVKTFHIAIHSDINGIEYIDEDGMYTCKPFYGYRAAVDELETMIKKAGVK